MRASLTYEMDAHPLPKWARVGTNVAKYPQILEESSRTHYRSTRFRGRPTRTWFSGVLPQKMPEIEGAVLEAMQRIGENWERSK